MNRNELLSLAIEATGAASKVLMNSKRLDFSRANLHSSSEIDFQLFSVIEQILRPSELAILGEDRSVGWLGERPEADFWVVDPLDGTINVLAGSPDSAVSVAVRDASNTTKAGSIDIPFQGLRLSGKKGFGVLVNDREIELNYSKRVSPIVSFGVGRNSSNNFKKTRRIVNYCIDNDIVTRQSGSSVVDISRVALGIWDVYFQEGLYLWDFAAAQLIIEETGGLFVCMEETGEFPIGQEQYTVCAIRKGAPVTDELVECLIDKEFR